MPRRTKEETEKTRMGLLYGAERVVREYGVGSSTLDQVAQGGRHVARHHPMAPQRQGGVVGTHDAAGLHFTRGAGGPGHRTPPSTAAERTWPCPWTLQGHGSRHARGQRDAIAAHMME